MKILHTITTMDPTMGGVCQAVRTIAASMNQLGLTNEIVCLDEPNASYLQNEKLTVHTVGPAKGPWAHSSLLEPWLKKNLRDYDIVIIHGIWQFQSHATTRIVRQMRRSPAVPRLYVMPHGMLDPYFQRAPGRKLKAIRNYFYWKVIERHTLNEADGVLFTCEEEKQLARKSFSPYSPQKELVVGLGVDEPPAQTRAIEDSFRKLGRKKNSYLLFMSRLHEKKGVDLLIRAFSQVFKGQAVLGSLVVAGPGLETPYGKHLRSLASEDSSIKELVSFTGMVSGDFKWATLYNCDVFVLPSHQENFGIAVVEALACGKPVLISDQVNIWREIDAAQCGLIGSDSLEGTIGLLKKWTALPEVEKIEMGKRAKALYQKSFSVKQTALRLAHALGVPELVSEQQ